MGNETKWANVAHYYTKSQIDLQIKNRDHAERFLMVSFRNVGGSHFEEWVNDGVYWRAYGSQFSAWDDHKPILRHRDDMTEAEAREIYRLVWGFDIDISVSMWDSGIDYFESLYGRYPSAVFLWLISRGFDVFGLIESGQAIRKEMGNGNS